MKRIAWIMVNHNGGEEVLASLQSLKADLTPEDTVILVDNGSSDGSDVRAMEQVTDLILINTGENLTYAEANNWGIRHALELGYPVIGIINPDVRVVPGMNSKLLSCLGNRADVDRSAVSPVILYEKPEGKIWFAGGYILWLLGWVGHRGQNRDATDAPRFTGITSYLTGCCFVTRSQVWDEVGLLDTRYGMYAEDLDWSWRAKLKGVALQVDGEARLIHRISQSSGGGRTPFKMWYRSKATRLFFRRWSSQTRYLIQSALRFGPILLYASILCLHGEWAALRSYMRAQFEPVTDPIPWPPPAK